MPDKKTAIKHIFSLLLFLLAYGSLSAQNKPTKSQILKLIRSSIRTTKEANETGFEYWTICNQDSAFYKADTIRLYNNINYFYQISTCCKFIDLAFYKKDAFRIRGSQICDEPTSASGHSDYYQFDILKNADKLYFRITNAKRKVSEFEIIKTNIIKLANNGSTDVIELKRLK